VPLAVIAAIRGMGGYGTGNAGMTAMASLADVDMHSQEGEDPGTNILHLAARLCVPKIRFCNIGDEDRRGQVAM
jgi:hypothetical protein